MLWNHFELAYLMRTFYFPEESSTEKVDKIINSMKRIYVNSEKHRKAGEEDIHFLDFEFFYTFLSEEIFKSSSRAPSIKELREFNPFYEGWDFLKKK
jgi:hypothetical protein